MVDWIAGALVDDFSVVGRDYRCAVTAGIQREPEDYFRLRDGEFCWRILGEGSWNLALGLQSELAVLYIKANGRVGLGGVSVLAGKSVKLSGGCSGRRSLG